MYAPTGTMKWTTSISDGTVKCNGDDCAGACIPQGKKVQTRHGNESSMPSAYPDDPTSFCVPCVTPWDIRKLDEREPGEAALKMARKVLGVIAPNDLMFETERAQRRVANVLEGYHPTINGESLEN